MVMLSRFIVICNLLLCSVALLSCKPNVPEDAAQLIADSSFIDVQDEELTALGAWKLAPNMNPDIYEVKLGNGEARNVCFSSGDNSYCRDVKVGDQFDFDIIYKDNVYPTRFTGVYQPPAAVFSEAYIKAHKGKTTILVPEVYELVNIAIALTVEADKSEYMVYKYSPYYTEVQTYFADMKDHPFVQWLDDGMRNGRYFHHKMNGYAFVYDDKGKIVQSSIYSRTSFLMTPNTLLPKLADMQSFSEQSNFREFYKSHIGVYEKQIDFVRDGIDTQKMFLWLQREFPDVDAYDHIKVIFSPLVSGNQSVTWIESNGFTELQPHINFPYPSTREKPISDISKNMERGKLLFTEMNHGFINPTADNYAKEINEAISNRALWVSKDTPADTYGNASQVFNEYMNWVLVEFYYIDYAPKEDLKYLLEANRAYMKDQRGFIKFPEFSVFVDNLYQNRMPEQTIADLYPQIIKWLHTQNVKSAISTP